MVAFCLPCHHFGSGSLQTKPLIVLSAPAVASECSGTDEAHSDTVPIGV